jgi:hypothetical protein
VAPVHEEVAQEHRFHSLQPPGLACHGLAKIWRHNRIDPASQLEKEPEYNTSPEQMTPEKEADVCEKTGTKEALARLRRKDDLKWTKDKNEYDKDKPGSGKQVEHVNANRMGVVQSMTAFIVLGILAGKRGSLVRRQ